MFCHRNSILIGVLLIAMAACASVTSKKDTTGQAANDGNWLIPHNEVVDGGPGKDGIPSIDNPHFIPLSEVTHVGEERMVTGIRMGNTVKLYPHQVLDHHEIVNDNINGIPMCISYCPLTGTAIAWKRIIDGEEVEYGVSGLLFRNNLIPYDRKTDTNYSQMQMRGVNGPRANIYLNTRQVVQSKWKHWKKMYPDARVLSTNTGYNRSYQGFLYSKEYLTKEYTLFPRRFEDHRLPNKEDVYGVIADKTPTQNSPAKVYEIDEFGKGITLVHDKAGDDKIIVAGSTEFHFAVSFKRTLKDGTTLEFEAVQDSLPVIMKDQEGNRWDIFGYAVKGPRKGQRLPSTTSYQGYWFGWSDFFPAVGIYDFPENE